MILYSIIRKQDCRFFCGTDWNGTEQWRSKPVYWRTSISIWKNLKRLCSQYYIKKTTFSWTDHVYQNKDWKNFDEEKLSLYDVIITEVNVLGEKRVSAKEFVIPSDLEKMEVSI